MVDPTRRSFLVQAAAASSAAAMQEAPKPQPGDPPRRHLFAGNWPAKKLERVLLPADRWKPYPPARDRAAWEALSPAVRTELVAEGERSLAGPWPVLPASLFLGFVRTGNRSEYEAMYNARRNRLRALTVAECVEGKGRFLDEIANGVWAVCEETFWGVPAHMHFQKRGLGLPDVTENVIDLFAAETGAQIAWTDYLLRPQLEQVHPLIGERMRYEIERRILEVYRTRNDFWWFGFTRTYVNNWNPWINSNCLTCALLLGRPNRRTALIHKILRSMDRFLDGYYDDGGCDEGPSYWGHAGGSLFDCLELLYSASAGAIDFYSTPLIQEIGRYIYRLHIKDDWFVNFADAAAKGRISGDLVYRYGRRIGDERMAAFGAWEVQRSSPGHSGSLGRVLPALFGVPPATSARAAQPFVRDAWIPGIGVMTARLKDGSPEGLYLAAQGGHNDESHNHNDVGNFVVYAGGEPVVIDVGVGAYTAKTFSPQRYEIWTMQSAYHNLPTVNGVMQGAGRQFAARQVVYRSGDDAAEFSLDIAAAYPAEAGITTWKRSFRLDRRRNEIEVKDDYALAKAASEIQFTLMTPGPVQTERGLLRLAERAVVRYDGEALTPKVEPIDIDDRDVRLVTAWGKRIFRVLLIARRPPARGVFTLRFSQS